MSLELRDQILTLEAGEFYFVPHWVEHRTSAIAEAEVPRERSQIATFNI
jgi:hypothetical protein